MENKELEEKFGQQIAKELGKCVNGATEIILRTGEALKPKEPRTLDICGVIDTPVKYLEKHSDVIRQDLAHVIVSREEMGVVLFMNNHSHYCDIIRGRLIISPEFKKFGINSGEYTTGLSLSDLIRMNRSYFADRNKAAELVTIMRNFKATVTKEIETNDDKKGNRMAYVRQVLEGNQPPSFELNIPIFKGQPKQSFTVEIDIDPDTLQATLVSPAAQELMDDMRDELIDGVVDDIRDLCPNIPIMEV